MDLSIMGDGVQFNLSCDFSDALDVISSTDPDYASKSNVHHHHQQQQQQQLTSQCMVAAAQHFMSQQSQSNYAVPQQQQQQQQQQQHHLATRQLHSQLQQQQRYQQQQQYFKPTAPHQMASQQIRQPTSQQQFQNSFASSAQIPHQQQSMSQIQQQPMSQSRHSSGYHQVYQQQYHQPTPAVSRAQCQQRLQNRQNLESQLQLQHQQQQQQQPIQSTLPQLQVQNQQQYHQRSSPPMASIHAQNKLQPRGSLPAQPDQSTTLPVLQPQVPNQQHYQQRSSPPVPLIQTHQVPLQNRLVQHQQPPKELPQRTNNLSSCRGELLIAQQQLLSSAQFQSTRTQDSQQKRVARTFVPPQVPQQVSQHAQMIARVAPQSQVKSTVATESSQQPHVEIVVQPAARGSRFRYGCEVRESGSIPGVNSRPDAKTYPTIRVVNYSGNAKMVVSCVTKDEPYKPHPHNLVGKSWCKNGICMVNLTKDKMSVPLDKLGIQCIKRKDMPASLKRREQLKVDPFKTGFEHKHDPGSIDQSCLRLAFQVFLENPKDGQFNIPLQPIVSDPIYDKKNSPDLSIYKLSHCSGPTDGQDMIILCDKVCKDDIQIRFYEERDEELVWEEFADLTKTGAVHKHVAILFRCPRYRTLNLSETVTVFVELVRPSDGMCSNSAQFEYISTNDPNDSIGMKRKRKRLNGSIPTHKLEADLAEISYSDQWNLVSQSNFNIIEAR